MKVVSRLLPEPLRHRLRHSFDSLYSKPLPGKETIGDRSQWTIVTRDLHEDAVVYSGGVGEDITFEQELIRRFGVKIHIFDPSPVAIQTIRQSSNDRLLFKPVGLTASGAGQFAIGGGEGSNIWLKVAEKSDQDAGIPCTSLPHEMKKNRHEAIDLLKLDIEGFEYEVLESCLSQGIRIKQLCVEFHDFFPKIPKERTKSMLRLLRSHGFELIHRHRHDHTFLLREDMRMPCLSSTSNHLSQ
jgi:FkbM family methyltransferase